MISLTVPLKTQSPNGSHMHWHVIAGRKKAQRNAIAKAWQAIGYATAQQAREWLRRGGSVDVLLTRISAGELDDDNLRGALKAVRDQVALQLGVSDDRDDRYTWRYEQARGKRGAPAVRIEVTIVP